MIATVNVIGDVAGRFDTLQNLLTKLPPADFTVLVGDMVDRGPRNMKVLDLVRSGRTTQGGKLVAIAGNHEYMMLDGYSGKDRHDEAVWLNNGGGATKKELDAMPPEEVRELMTWVNELPVYLEFGDLLVTHAPHQQLEWYPNEAEIDRIAFTWYRNNPRSPVVCGGTGQRLFNVYGHNGKLSMLLDKDNKPYACCIDDSHNRNMAAFCWPSMKVISVPESEERAY